MVNEIKELVIDLNLVSVGDFLKLVDDKVFKWIGPEENLQVTLKSHNCCNIFQ
ncbi:hypothetical protein MetMK1DRAFT_00022680 [Metallosphaera yellowstonensis MK1]|jgi:hypothetical protein|uniref:Uncharacterized protein n=1 Tax=Metallosphaera yellowstonensis MK1 TaxID=671065 RepID=H2C6S6_9CREN|nr:hypothetical protein MetMK1DRAFT_00022680 [Metallosphaera yellowstonensis MK1]